MFSSGSHRTNDLLGYIAVLDESYNITLKIAVLQVADMESTKKRRGASPRELLSDQLHRAERIRFAVGICRRQTFSMTWRLCMVQVWLKTYSHFKDVHPNSKQKPYEQLICDQKTDIYEQLMTRSSRNFGDRLGPFVQISRTARTRMVIRGGGSGKAVTWIRSRRVGL